MSAPRAASAVDVKGIGVVVPGALLRLLPASKDCVQSVERIFDVATGSNSTDVLAPFVDSQTPWAAATRWLGSVGSMATGERKPRPGGPVVLTAPGWISVMVLPWSVVT